MDPRLGQIVRELLDLGLDPHLDSDNEGRLTLFVVLDPPPDADIVEAARLLEARLEAARLRSGRGLLPTSPTPDSSRSLSPGGRYPPGCGHLAPRLRELGGLTPAARLWRAYRLGVADGRVAQAARGGGSAVQEPSPPLPGARAAAYVVLCTEGEPEPRWTRSTRTYYELTHDLGPTPGVWLPGTVSRGLPSAAEAEAYCLGAGLASLPTAL